VTTGIGQVVLRQISALDGRVIAVTKANQNTRLQPWVIVEGSQKC
jgi:hypothetical protein